jgi:sterol desaturase/sphingolipid hydroxylase (fatty acid hydroxylase superfamily)
MIIAENRLNYWATYLIDTVLLIFFLYWDIGLLHVSPDVLIFYFCIGIFSWLMTEYIFHRWVYHGDAFTLSRKGHDQHHADPSSMIAMPFIVTPILLLLPQQTLAQFWILPGLASWMSGWLFGYITYSFFHHSLHHYSLPFSWYKRQRAYHRVHHAKPDKNFGVTSSCVDRLLGTYFKKLPVSIRQAKSAQSVTGVVG